MTSMNAIIDGVEYTLDVDDICVNDKYTSINKDPSIAGAGNLPWNAVAADYNNKTKRWYSGNTPLPHYFEIQYSVPKIITEFNLQPGNDWVNVLLKDFTISLYTKDNEYIDVYSDTHPKNDTDKIRYKLPNPIESTRFRITINSTYDNRGYRWASITCLKLYEKTQIYV